MRVLALFGLAAALGGSPASENTVAYVTADYLRVRAAAATDAAIVARLRIGAEARVLERRDAFVRVSSNGVEGWVASDQLGDEPIRLEPALEAASRAKGTARVDWLERAAALDPGRRSTWEALAAEYRALRLADKERHARDVLADRLPLYFAACRSVRAVYSPDGTFDDASLEKEVLGDEYFRNDNPPSPLDAPEARALPPLAAALATATWWPLDGAPISRALPKPALAAEQQACPGFRVTVALGEVSCPDDSPPRAAALLASAPAIPIPTEDGGPAALKRARAALGGTSDPLTVTRIPGAPPRWLVRSHGKAVGAELFDDAWRPLASAGPEAGDETDIGEPAVTRVGSLIVAVVSWHALTQVPSLGGEGTEPSGADGYFIFVIRPDGSARATSIIEARLWNGGC